MNHVHLELTECLDKTIKHIGKRSAFLTTRLEDKINTMAIGWATGGIVWGKPVFTAFVRESRYTHKFIEKSGEFTVSVPVNDNLKKALSFCGSKSGRDFDKIKDCNLKLIQGETISTPIIDGCGIYFECKTLYKSNIKPDFLNKKIDSQSYSNSDYHTIYYGEILSCYSLEK